MKNKKSKEINRRRTELLLSVVFTGLMFILSWSDVTYIPISDSRLLDMSLVPIVFVAMIGGYTVAIPVGIGWGLSAILNQPGEFYTWEWIMVAKLSFTLSLVFFYALAKKIHPRSPWNVYRTLVAAITLKAIIATIGIRVMFPHLELGTLIKESIAQMIIELAVSALAMSLLIEKLRKIHVLNGVRRKEKKLSN